MIRKFFVNFAGFAVLFIAVVLTVVLTGLGVRFLEYLFDFMDPFWKSVSATAGLLLFFCGFMAAVETFVDVKR